MTIILTEGGQKPQKLNRQTIDRERYLQDYIWENPDVLPLEEYKPGVRLVTLAREFPTASGPLDGFAVDQDGEVYLIESKLYKNPDKRFVLAQVLDYGAALWRTDARDVLAVLEEHVRAHHGESVTTVLADAFELSEDETDAVLESLTENLSTGTYRFIVLLDHVDDRLRSLVSFINHNSRFDVFCVSLDFYRSGQTEIVIPTLHGPTARKPSGTSKPSGRRKWDEQTFFEDAMRRLAPDAVAAIRTLYDWAIRHGGGVVWGSGVRVASFNPRFDHVSKRSVFSLYSDGTFELHFKWLKDGGAPAYAEELGRSFREDGGFAIPNDYLRRHVGFGVEAWAPKLGVITEILRAVLITARPKA
jgi:hypothetical protein